MKTVDVRKSLLSLKSQIDSCLKAIESDDISVYRKERFKNTITEFNDKWVKFFQSKGVLVKNISDPNAMDGVFKNIEEGMDKFKLDDVYAVTHDMENVFEDLNVAYPDANKSNFIKIMDQYKAQRMKLRALADDYRSTQELLINLSIGAIALSILTILLFENAPFTKMKDIMKNTYNNMVSTIKSGDMSVSKVISIVMLPIKYALSVAYQTFKEFPMVMGLLMMSGFLFMAAVYYGELIKKL